MYLFIIQAWLRRTLVLLQAAQQNCANALAIYEHSS